MNTSLRKKLGSRVMALRKNAGLTQEVFAEKSGFARTYLSRIETGKANVSLEALHVLAVTLNISLSDLLKDLDH